MHYATQSFPMTGLRGVFKDTAPSIQSLYSRIVISTAGMGYRESDCTLEVPETGLKYFQDIILCFSSRERERFI